MHFGGGFPPQIVVALQNDLFARQRVDQRKIAFRFRKVDAPRNIPAQNNGVLRRNKRTPVFDDLFRVPLPPGRRKYPSAWLHRRQGADRQAYKAPLQILEQTDGGQNVGLVYHAVKARRLAARAASGAGAGTPVS